ncbi:RHS repeat-associated core domain-containing protein [Candidatus Pollutiaquabacter sp.]|uniref:RHS repeat-associated core domain-containing protein n=1 Tax=Candidatus Pollutiaquabacter sp. TaxID=3416354 RepID=UPI003CBCA4B2|nr:RHS repeat-associated core domain-containing protein [Bacteroidota bacterium]
MKLRYVRSVFLRVVNGAAGSKRSATARAFFRYRFFDKYFNLDPTRSGIRKANNPDQLAMLSAEEISFNTTGYFYVYVTNESPTDVSFDNLLIKHYPGFLLQENHYYPFGLLNKALSSDEQKGFHQRYGFNGKEFENGLDWRVNDFGARMYDPVLGRWGSVDPLSHAYANASPYVFVLNNPINAIDPDGRRVYFIGGANNDRDGWNYINRWRSSFASAGVNDFVRINASQGKAGDIMFTNLYRNSGTEQEYRTRKDPGEGSYREYTGRELPVNNTMINRTVETYKQHLANNQLKDGEQLNMAGYSYGSVLQAQVALKLANGGVEVDNLILIGSPISDNSDLFKQLSGNKNIKNIIRIDIPNDKFSNPGTSMEYILGGWQNRNENGPHFDLARPGIESDKRIQQAVDQIKNNGVKN